MEGDISSLARMSGARPRGTLAVLGVGILAISTAAPLIKLVPDVPPLVVAAFRLGLAALIFTPLSLVRLRTAGSSPSLPDLLVVSVAGLCLALHFAAWIASLRYTSVASSVALVTMNPLLLAIAGYLIWRERLVRRQWCGIGLALLGGLCIGWNDFQQAGPALESALYGDVLAICGAVMISAYLLCGRLGSTASRPERVCRAGLWVCGGYLTRRLFCPPTAVTGLCPTSLPRPDPACPYPPSVGPYHSELGIGLYVSDTGRTGDSWRTSWSCPVGLDIS